MNLKIQIIALVFSFIFGVFYAFLVRVTKRFLFSGKWIISIISSLIFNLLLSLLYFLLLNIINNGMLHIYFLLMFLLGSYSGYCLFRLYSKKKCQT